MLKLWTSHSPKKDDFEKTSADLEMRAKRLGGEHNAHNVGNDEIVYSVAQFIRVLGKANATATKFTFAIVALTLITILLIVIQILDAHRLVRVQNNIALNNEFFNSPTNLRIISALENNTPILKEHGGKLDATQLNNYLGDYETIDGAYEDNGYAEIDLCASFSYYIVATHNNKEIQQYMNRKENADYFGGFDNLYRVVLESKNPLCH